MADFFLESERVILCCEKNEMPALRRTIKVCFLTKSDPGGDGGVLEGDTLMKLEKCNFSTLFGERNWKGVGKFLQYMALYITRY